MSFVKDIVNGAMDVAKKAATFEINKQLASIANDPEALAEAQAELAEKQQRNEDKKAAKEAAEDALWEDKAP